MNEMARQAKEAMSRRGTTGRQAWIDAERDIARQKHKRARMFHKACKLQNNLTYGTCAQTIGTIDFVFHPTYIGLMYRAITEAMYLYNMGVGDYDTHLHYWPETRFIYILMRMTTKLPNEIKKGKVKVIVE